MEDLTTFIKSSTRTELRVVVVASSTHYCRTRDATELTKKGVACLVYHAGLKVSERNQVQEDWVDGKMPVITATVSFGMGMDKGSVRFVAHWNVPQSVAAYYKVISFIKV